MTLEVDPLLEELATSQGLQEGLGRLSSPVGIVPRLLSLIPAPTSTFSFSAPWHPNLTCSLDYVFYSSDLWTSYLQGRCPLPLPQPFHILLFLQLSAHVSAPRTGFSSHTLMLPLYTHAHRGPGTLDHIIQFISFMAVIIIFT